ncbi:hypothetical protein Mpet_1553 [Methanolacinia petrolearia DSM 11571]|uniref:Uncharacterized protein n=1 Tax=Methanolacinia petrolearia (strain DSM 11571 / OCM 486 / SEBR 4847) TaxID=679926 RepID=E1RGL5_METP4|nr:hypothetical protein Mpet_1553 [Methanolacinia petrolearia DSM 11571]
MSYSQLGATGGICSSDQTLLKTIRCYFQRKWNEDHVIKSVIPVFPDYTPADTTGNSYVSAMADKGLHAGC